MTDLRETKKAGNKTTETGAWEDRDRDRDSTEKIKSRHSRRKITEGLEDKRRAMNKEDEQTERHHHENEKTVVRERDTANAETSFEKVWSGDIHALRTEDGTGELLEYETDAEGGEKTVNFSPIET